MGKRLEHVEAAKEEAARLGAMLIITRRTKHLCGLLSLNGKYRKIFLSISPSDGRVCDNVREDVRKKIKEMM